MDELLLEPDSSRPCISVVKVEPGLSSNYDSEFASETLEYEELKVNLGEFQNLQEFSVKTELTNSDEENCTSDTKDNKLFTFENEDFQQMNVNEQYGLSVKEEELDISEELYRANEQQQDEDLKFPRDKQESSSEEPKKVNCELCKGLYANNRNLRKHLIRIHKLLVCSTRKCKFLTDDPEKLEIHIEQLHPSRKATCRECKLASRNPNLLKKHVWEAHAIKKKYKCEECFYGTEKAFFIRKHLTTVHHKHVCDIGKCLFVTNDESEVEDHKDKMHQNESFLCNCCDFTCRAFHSLKAHKKSFHSISKQDPWGHNPFKEAYLRELQSIK